MQSNQSFNLLGLVAILIWVLGACNMLGQPAGSARTNHAPAIVQQTAVTMQLSDSSSGWTTIQFDNNRNG
jgi:hypothetical protein